MHPCTTSHSHTHLHPFFANQSRSGGGNKNFAHQVIVTGPPLKSKIGLVYGVTHGEVWWGVRAVETLSIFGPLSFGTGAQHSIEEYPDCGQFQLFEPLSNTWSRRKLGGQRDMKDLQNVWTNHQQEVLYAKLWLSGWDNATPKRQYTFQWLLIPICQCSSGRVLSGSLKQNATNQIWLQLRQSKNRLQQA